MTPATEASEDIDDALLPISALQHYLFCPRQCALIHVERLWVEDAATAEGRLLHERVDGGKSDRRRGVRIARGLVLVSRRHGLAGRADVVEFHGADTQARAYPVEYKRGRPKAHRADEVQLCAQALCLEEMFGQPIAEGALFYGNIQRRTVVQFDEALRALTTTAIDNVRTMLAAGRTPPPVAMPACRHCSLQDECLPERLARPPGVMRWFAAQLEG